ncbi:YjgN family protein [Paraglaciecola mesophila]|uniref:YjgN family protein n=1 Tax=Paraglaciecola mesophila TaxID=197222 RepID=A0ABU9T297_9ALTE
MDKHIDYSQYSYEDLLSAKAGLDQETYPERAAELDKLISEKRQIAIESTSSPLVNSSQLRESDVIFHGKTAEFFGIWIVNILLTIVTLGIYSAWATVRTNRYFYSNTEIDGHRFSYLANPIQILKGRIIAVILFAVYSIASAFSPTLLLIFIVAFIFLTPIMIISAVRFKMRMTSYRNVKFGFKGQYGDAFATFILLPIVSVFTLYLALPWVLKKIDEFLHNNMTYGQQNFSTELKSSEYYIASIGALILGVVVAGLSLFALGASVSTLSADTAQASTFSMTTIGIMFGYLVVFIIATSFYHAHVRNHLFNSTQIEGVARFTSTVATTKLIGLRLSNFVALIATLGFALPWIHIRTSQFYADVTQVTILEGIDKVVDGAQDDTSALGEEVANVFDVDIALG